MQQSWKDAFKRVLAGLFFGYAVTAGLGLSFHAVVFEGEHDVLFLLPFLIFSLVYSARYVYITMKDA